MKKILNVMKLTTLLIIASMLQVSAITLAQNITMNKKNVQLSMVFKAIRKQTGYNILWRPDNLDASARIDASFNNAPLDAVMKACLRDQFTYTVDEKTILITPSKKVAQNVVAAIDVRGSVLDETGKGIPGATIKVKGTELVVASEVNGQFELKNVDENSILIITYVGYATQEVKVSANMTIKLAPAVNNLNEVVIVVGYGTQKKVNLTGAVSTVSAAELENRPVTGVTNALEGTIPGVTISSNNGQPGMDAGSINIRGQSLNSTSALVVIDGVISTTGDMNAINADDIDNISVLKDAASASIYGNRAAGGVIVITTKKGKKGTAQITYSDYFGKNKPVALPDYLPSWQAATLYDEARVNEAQTPVYTAAQIQTFKNGSDPFNYPNTDWLKLFYSGNGFQQNHYIGVNGGGDKTTYALSLGYFDENGITPKTNTQRYTSRLNLNSQIKDNISVFGYLSYTYQPLTQPQSSLSADQGFDQVIRQFNRISSIIPAYYANGDYGHIADGSPLAWINSPSFDDQNAYNFQGNVGGDGKLLKACILSLH